MQRPHFARTRYHRARSLSAVISPNEVIAFPGSEKMGRERVAREAVF